MNQYHRVYAEININRIIENLTNISNYVGDQTKVMLVIKADGYGHGAIPISKALNKEDIDYLAVATIDEAISLREAGIELPLLVFGFTPVDKYPDLIMLNITQTIYQEDMANSLSDVAVSMGAEAKIHLKIDSGMNRIGFKSDAATINTVKSISELKGLIIEGIFTHFSKADEGTRAYTDNQITQFNRIVSELAHVGVKPPIIHLSNSAGMIDYRKGHGTMVRVGIALYGLYPSDKVNHEELKLKPSLSLKSHVIFVKDIEAGDKVSYGGIYTAPSKRRIATIPVGYGDGYPRALSNIGRVIIKGHFAPIIGRICMDQFMVDVTDIEAVVCGDLVTLIGEDHGSSITVEEIASLRDTINYEIVCQLGKRIPRVYMRDDVVIETVDYF
ncbi:MAG: alanine racemase [Vallitaleaceae bacterium]|jgi:alanine racemase|nr:alanine racemase [Vallitaleaceae bacterium]